MDDPFDFAAIVREHQESVGAGAGAGTSAASPAGLDSAALLARARTLAESFAARGVPVDTGLLMSILEGEFGMGALFLRSQVAVALADVQRAAPPRPPARVPAVVSVFPSTSEDSNESGSSSIEPPRRASSASATRSRERTSLSKAEAKIKAKAKSRPSRAPADCEGDDDDDDDDDDGSDDGCGDDEDDALDGFEEEEEEVEDDADDVSAYSDDDAIVIVASDSDEEAGVKAKVKAKKGSTVAEVSPIKGKAAVDKRGKAGKNGGKETVAARVKGGGGKEAPASSAKKLRPAGAGGVEATADVVTDGAGGVGAATDAAPRQPKHSATLPLLLPKNLKSRSTLLVQIEDSKFDLSGDVGAIGRLTVIPRSGVILDLKGVQYAGTVVPSCSFFVVGLTGDSAKIEAHTTDFLQLEHVSNMLDSLSGALMSGGIDAALLEFDDVMCTEAAAVHDTVDDEDGGATPGASAGAGAGAKGKATKGKGKTKGKATGWANDKSGNPALAKHKAVGSDDDRDGDGEDDSDFEAPAKKATKAKTKKAPGEGKMIGRKVRVGKKRSKKQK